LLQVNPLLIYRFPGSQAATARKLAPSAVGDAAERHHAAAGGGGGARGTACAEDLETGGDLITLW